MVWQGGKVLSPGYTSWRLLMHIAAQTQQRQRSSAVLGHAVRGEHWAMHICCRQGTHRSTMILADFRAACVGMLWGSRAWMFLPVGRTAGFLMGSPPGPAGAL